MSQAVFKRYTDGNGGGGWTFHCPGCDSRHAINDTWQCNGDTVKPTVSPSILVRSGHFCPDHKPGDRCWCDYNREHPEDAAAGNTFECFVCHSFIRNGMIEFCSDSTHKLSGQTVPLPPIESSTSS